MTQVCNAVYENGLFRPPCAPFPGLAVSLQLRLVVETVSPEEIPALAARVYDGLLQQGVRDVE